MSDFNDDMSVRANHVRSTADGFRVLLVYCNTMMDNLIPVGVSLVAASLKNAGVEVKLFDTTFYRTKDLSGDEMRVKNYQIPPFSYSDFGVKFKESDMREDFDKTIRFFCPQLIGFSAVEPTYEMALELLAVAKRHGVKTVVGGIFAIFDYAKVIQCPEVDMVCLGEAETWFPELCRRIANGKDYWNTFAFWVKKDGVIYKNKIALLENMDKVPALDVSLYEKERFYRPMAGVIYKMMPIEFSRGCPFQCTYCADPGLAHRFKDSGTWLRYKSIDKIINEIRFYISRYQINYFYFVSETFLAIPDRRFDEFVERYSDINVPFWFNTRPETITDRRMKKLKQIGCNRVSMGIEHGNEEFRKRVLGRNLSNETIRRALGIMNSSGISYSLNNVIGFPDETRELVFDTIEINRLAETDSIACCVFSPYRGTTLRTYCIEKGYIDPNIIVPDPHFDSVLDMPSMNRKEIAALARTFSMYAKFDKTRWDEIRLAEQDTPEGSAMFERIGKEFIKKFYI